MKTQQIESVISDYFPKNTNRLISVTRCDVCVLKNELGFCVLRRRIIQVNEFWEDPLGKSGALGEQNNFSLSVSKPYCVCSATRNISIGNTARYDPSRLQNV